MQDASYDPSARFEALAADRTAAVGRRLIAAADAFRDAVLDCLEAWEDEVEAGDSLRRPLDFPDVVELFHAADGASRLARVVRHRRDLAYVLATEAA